MGESSGKRQKRYVYCSKIESKPCLIHGPGHFSDECKVLGEFGAKFAKGKPNKDHGNNPIPRGEFNRHLENNDIINDVMD